MSEAKPSTPETLSAAPRRQVWVWVALALVLVSAAAIRFRLLELPLERDEGEYAYGGQLLLEGVPPYVGLYNMKFPGIYAAYAVIMAVFGQTIGGIHLGLILVNAATILLVYLIARRLMDPLGAVVAAAGYAILSISPAVMGLMAHATHFVVLAAMGGLLLLLKALESGRRLTLLASGVCLGLAVLMKQPGAMFAVCAALFLAWTEWRSPERSWRRLAMRLGLIAGGGAIPLALAALALWWAGAFGQFWHWTIAYAAQYGTVVTAGQGIQFFALTLPDVMGPSVWLWVLAGIGLVAVAWDPTVRRRAPFYIGGAVFLLLAAAVWHYWQQTMTFNAQNDAPRTTESLDRYKLFLWVLWGMLGAAAVVGVVAAARDRQPRSQAPLCAGLAAFSLAATAAGFYWRQHYFILMLPAVAILGGAAVSIGRRLVVETRLPKAVQLAPIGLFVAIFIYTGVQQREFLLELSPMEACRARYGLNPFPEALEVARYLRENTTPDDRVAVIGSEPEIYFYAHRRSATGYVYVYPLMESQPYAHEMQQGMIDEIVQARPKYLVLVSPVKLLQTSWLTQPQSDLAIFGWIDDWVQANYQVVGFLHFGPAKPIPQSWNDWKSTAVWGPAAGAQVQQWEKQRAEAFQKNQPPGTPLPKLSWVLFDVPVVAVLQLKGT